MSMGSEYIIESYVDEYEIRKKIEDEAKKGIWTTYDERRLNVREMNKDHIENTIKWIKRNDKTDIMLPWLMVFRNELIRRYGI